MKLNKKISKEIRKIRSSLAWSVRIEREDSVEGYGLRSYPQAHEHVITLPPKNPKVAKPSKAAELHEYIHAWLAETRHPLFAAPAFVNSLDNPFAKEAVRRCLNETLDWFVDHEVYVRCPRAFEHRLRVEFGSDDGGARDQLMMEEDPIAFPITLALADAQNWKYLGQHAGNRPEFIPRMTDAFLRVPPEHPTIGKATILFNSLLPIVPLSIKVRVVEAEGMAKWMLYEPNGQVAAGSKVNEVGLGKGAAR